MNNNPLSNHNNGGMNILSFENLMVVQIQATLKVLIVTLFDMLKVASYVNNPKVTQHAL
jgi:ABC-type arginine/histidine transport system permease subunit